MEIEYILTEDEFLAAINLPKSIIYLLVEWSGPERVSRGIVFKVLDNIDLKGVSVYQIDCSNTDATFLEDWLVKQGRSTSGFIYGGWGETLLFADGALLDFIQYPFTLGRKQVKAKIEGWLRTGLGNSLD